MKSIIACSRTSEHRDFFLALIPFNTFRTITNCAISFTIYLYALGTVATTRTRPAHPCDLLLFYKKLRCICFHYCYKTDIRRPCCTNTPRKNWIINLNRGGKIGIFFYYVPVGTENEFLKSLKFQCQRIVWM